MASKAPRPFGLFLLVLSIFSLTLQEHSECDIRNIPFTTEGGVQQVFQMKRIGKQAGIDGNCQEQPSPTDSETISKLKYDPPNGSRAVPSLLARPIRQAVNPLPVISNVFGIDSMHEAAIRMCNSSAKGPQCLEEPNDDDLTAIERMKEYAEVMLSQGLLPNPTGDDDIDEAIASSILLLYAGRLDESIKGFNLLLKDNPETVTALHGRGLAYRNKGISSIAHLNQAVLDFSTALHLNPFSIETYERRAETYLYLGLSRNAIGDLNRAIELEDKSPARYFIMRAYVAFTMEDLKQAEFDYQKGAEGYTDQDDEYYSALYQLGLVKFYMGKIRNAIEIFKEILRKRETHLESYFALCECFSDLGYVRRAKDIYEKFISNYPLLINAWRMKAFFHFSHGALDDSLRDAKHCLELDPNSLACQYLEGLAHVSLGNYYEGVKSVTKVMANSMVITPEYLKSHYIREHARYLHHHLDQNILDFDQDVDFTNQYKDHWINLAPFTTLQDYQEQPGIQPSIRDVDPQEFGSLSSEMQYLLCNATYQGALLQVEADGYLPSTRHNLAMGLAVIHIAQLMQTVWKSFHSDVQVESSRFSRDSISWMDVFNVAVRYRRLVDPEQPVFWLDNINHEKLNRGAFMYSNSISVVAGDTINVKVALYKDFMFDLMKNMVDRSNIIDPTNRAFKAEIDSTTSFQQLFDVIRKKNQRQRDYLVSTQVPAFKDHHQRLDGLVFSLAPDKFQRPVFALHLATTKKRTVSYYTQLDNVFNEILFLMKKNNHSKSDLDNIINLILSLAYYFHNLMPLSRGNSAVATSVVLGLILSLGREVTGKIGQGKLQEMEAILSGGPENFHVFCKTYMNIKKSNRLPSSLPQISELLPTTRNIVEALQVASKVNC